MVTNNTLSNIVEYYPDGTPQTAEWREKGRLHRTDGPAEIRYYPDGTIESEEWWKDGQWHRTDGPAYISYNPNGTIKREEYWQNGEQIIPADTQKH